MESIEPVEPVELAWESYTGYNHLKAVVPHGTWYIGPDRHPMELGGMCDINYLPVEAPQPTLHREELGQAASQGEAKIIIGLYERLGGLTGTIDDVLEAGGFRKTSNFDQQLPTRFYDRPTPTAGGFAYHHVIRDGSSWSSFTYEPSRANHWCNILIAKFYRLSYDKSFTILHKWPLIVRNPQLVTAAVACEMMKRRLATGGKRYRFPVC